MSDIILIITSEQLQCDRGCHETIYLGAQGRVMRTENVVSVLAVKMVEFFWEDSVWSSC